MIIWYRNVVEKGHLKILVKNRRSINKYLY